MVKVCREDKNIKLTINIDLSTLSGIHNEIKRIKHETGEDSTIKEIVEIAIKDAFDPSTHRYQ